MSWLNKNSQNTKGSDSWPSRHAVSPCFSLSDGDQRGWRESVRLSHRHHHTERYRQLPSHRSSAAQGLQCGGVGQNVESGQNCVFVHQLSVLRGVRQWMVFTVSAFSTSIRPCPASYLKPGISGSRQSKVFQTSLPPAMISTFSWWIQIPKARSDQQRQRNSQTDKREKFYYVAYWLMVEQGQEAGPKQHLARWNLMVNLCPVDVNGGRLWSLVIVLCVMSSHVIG